MSQLALFASDPGQPEVLVDDAHGRIVHRAGLVDVTTARRWFDALHRSVPWQSERRQMYDRDVDVPRLHAHFDLADPVAPPELAEALSCVRAVEPAAYDRVGVNLYRDARDSVAPHNDRLAGLARGQPIALLSLGATRRMTIRSKALPRRSLQVDLHAGSLLTMSWSTQLHYDHGIPKARGMVGPRISLAFRVGTHATVAR